ncbi:hypothetical protein XBP1_2080005 [Xenorhabdus bovienii str. puntauvense]|uniref:Uncharacterized protein n=2 Tax=Xenorhabdus bovienii TaxID=40576 RepID=A0A0B6X5U9_XENBV|nr:hypothetical protein XBFFR1_660002 [Xenorhabdus bovienii str. feltiae France]CDG93921.1 hypothetical protein XBFFL1_280002 [Xenorhabdus bovienii str. feltiae Florida]CDG96422.1 hypothetical protein XBP1_2080005 [Xenorhabdus bovienii str. puntauvense]CDM88526.1 hypothetical protein XBW1_1169 [Xenorhabdus bovienii]
MTYTKNVILEMFYYINSLVSGSRQFIEASMVEAIEASPFMIMKINKAGPSLPIQFSFFAIELIMKSVKLEHL